jgi:hypothetical protein
MFFYIKNSNMVDKFVINFLKDLSIPPINGQYYNEIDEAHAIYALILSLLLMISIVVICV